jgi:Glycosyl hydrolases family 16
VFLSRTPAARALSLLVTALAALSVLVPVTARAGTSVPGATEIAQHVRITVLPPIAHVGASPESSAAAQTVISASVTPVLVGRPVELARRQRGEWVAVDRAQLGRSGRVEFTARTRVGGRRVLYRVIAQPYRRLESQSSAAVWSTTWGRPDFVDEFDGPGLDATWRTRIPFYNPWGGRTCAKGSPEAAQTQGGALVLSSLPDRTMPSPCTAYRSDGTPLGAFPYRLNGHVSTEGVADFQYGVAAARMRLQRNAGQHAAFWLQPRGLLPDRPTPWGAEIDVIEWFGEGAGGGMASNVYHPVAGEKAKVGGRIGGGAERFLAGRSDSWWGNYHVFSVEWTPSEYVFRIDGHETWRTDQGVSHHPQFLILSLLSSDYELPNAHDPRVPEHTYVDWVQFWRAD